MIIHPGSSETTMMKLPVLLRSNIFSVDPPQVYGHYHPVAFMNAITTVFSFSWRALENRPCAFIPDYRIAASSFPRNYFVAAGCDVMAWEHKHPLSLWQRDDKFLPLSENISIPSAKHPIPTLVGDQFLNQIMKVAEIGEVEVLL